MSLLTPVKVPVKVYRWDDAGAPALDRTPNCMMTIFKACLVTGYGTKEGAGWTMQFEDTSAGVKVFRPEISPHADFYLRVSTDTGAEMASEVYLNMTDANTGDLKLKMPEPFKFGYAGSGRWTGKWVLIASSHGFYFFSGSGYAGNANKSGTFFMMGESVSSSTGKKAVFLHHSGGGNVYGDYAGIFSGGNGRYQAPSFLVDEVVTTGGWSGVFNGRANLTSEIYFCEIFAAIGNEIYIPAGIVIPSNMSKNNYEVSYLDGDEVIMHGSSAYSDEIVGVNTKEWRY